MSNDLGVSSKPVRATITKVEERYVITVPIQDCGSLKTTDSVTFSRSRWFGAINPQPGQVVDLYDTVLYKQGWKADRASPVTPQQQATRIRSVR